MILVDTSVIIDVLRGRETEKAALFRQIAERDLDFGISILTYQEVLQGARDPQEFRLLEEYLGAQTLYYLPADPGFFARASTLHTKLRRMGVTPRGTIGVLIAATALEHGLYLVHDDRDFDLMAERISELKILNALP